MSIVLETVPSTADDAPVQGDLLEAAASPLAMSLQDFVAEFGDELLDSLNRANPPVYAGQARPHRQLVLASLKRKLFGAQAEVVHAVTELLADRGERAALMPQAEGGVVATRPLRLVLLALQERRQERQQGRQQPDRGGHQLRHQRGTDGAGSKFVVRFDLCAIQRVIRLSFAHIDDDEIQREWNFGQWFWQ